MIDVTERSILFTWDGLETSSGYVVHFGECAMSFNGSFLGHFETGNHDFRGPNQPECIMCHEPVLVRSSRNIYY